LYVVSPQSTELQNKIEEEEHAISSLEQRLTGARSKFHSLKTSLEDQIQTLEVSLSTEWCAVKQF